MMRFLLLMVVTLSGCATVQQRAEAGTTYLMCGTTRLDISHDRRQAVVRASNGQQGVLRRSDSNLGTRYVGLGYSLIRSDDTYIVTTPDGSASNCAKVEEED